MLKMLSQICIGHIGRLQDMSCPDREVPEFPEFPMKTFLLSFVSQALMRWSLERTEEILFSPSSSSWNTRWLEVLNDADREGDWAAEGSEFEVFFKTIFSYF